eukprot:351362-Chlamydomonas_euryale.AAC.1
MHPLAAGHEHAAGASSLQSPPRTPATLYPAPSLHPCDWGCAPVIGVVPWLYLVPTPIPNWDPSHLARRPLPFPQRDPRPALAGD